MLNKAGVRNESEVTTLVVDNTIHHEAKKEAAPPIRVENRASPGRNKYSVGYSGKQIKPKAPFFGAQH